MATENPKTLKYSRNKSDYPNIEKCQSRPNLLRCNFYWRPSLSYNPKPMKKTYLTHFSMHGFSKLYPESVLLSYWCLGGPSGTLSPLQGIFLSSPQSRFGLSPFLLHWTSLTYPSSLAASPQAPLHCCHCVSSLGYPSLCRLRYAEHCRLVWMV